MAYLFYPLIDDRLLSLVQYMIDCSHEVPLKEGPQNPINCYGMYIVM